jgi:hypothetical protein
MNSQLALVCRPKTEPFQVSIIFVTTTAVRPVEFVGIEQTDGLDHLARCSALTGYFGPAAGTQDVVEAAEPNPLAVGTLGHRGVTRGAFLRAGHRSPPFTLVSHLRICHQQQLRKKATARQAPAAIESMLVVSMTWPFIAR